MFASISVGWYQGAGGGGGIDTRALDGASGAASDDGGAGRGSCTCGCDGGIDGLRAGGGIDPRGRGTLGAGVPGDGGTERGCAGIDGVLGACGGGGGGGGGGTASGAGGSDGGAISTSSARTSVAFSRPSMSVTRASVSPSCAMSAAEIDGREGIGEATSSGASISGSVRRGTGSFGTRSLRVGRRRDATTSATGTSLSPDRPGGLPR
ncbi:MAG: hypothetical protein WCJ30_27315, partial [Deltaproteobacteria bacterium]